MAVQVNSNLTNEPFFLSGTRVSKEAETVVQDAGRSGAMVKYTLMAYDPATGKWNSFTNEAATDGTQFPRGILMADLTEAEIKAGDVVDVPIVVGGGFTFDSSQLTIENSKTLATVINVPANFNTSVEDFLRMVGMYPESTQSQDAFQS